MAERHSAKLVYDSSGEFDLNNIRYIYGYTFNPKANSEDKRIVRNYLKNLGAKVFDEDIDDFVEDGFANYVGTQMTESFLMQL